MIAETSGPVRQLSITSVNAAELLQTTDVVSIEEPLDMTTILLGGFYILKG